MNFTAIDFETANSSRGSACAVALCIVQDGIISRCVNHHIRPEPLYFSPFNVSIHGITEKDVANAPAFREIWPNIIKDISGPLVAHNASFDIGVIRKSLDAADLQYPTLDYYCTRVLSKMAWPGLPSYGLDQMARMLGFSLDHHNAADDARVCALLALESCTILGASSLKELEQPFAFSCGRLYPNGYSYCQGRPTGSDSQAGISTTISMNGIKVDAYPKKTVHPCSKRKPLGKAKASNITASVQDFNPDHPFYRKSFAFTGAITALHRRDAMQAVVDHGGYCHDNVSKGTDYLVLGQAGYYSYTSGLKTTKMQKFEDMKSQGLPIEILSESDFISLL